MTLVTLVLFATAAGSVAPPVARTDYAQVTIRQRVIVRVPVVPIQTVQQAPLRWVEKKGPKCLGLDRLAGFVVRGPQIVDLFIRGGQRVRARLEKQCTAVDLGYGFYIRPHADGRICTNRDTFHARTGGKCEVERFANLVPER